MSPEELVDYTFSRLEGGELERMERALRDDPEAAAHVENLREASARLLDDGGDWCEPPPGLAERTVRFVAQNRRRPVPFLDRVPPRLSFGWPDFAVAASIFIAGMLTLLPAIQRSRERMNQAGCVFNLQQLGNSLGQYASLHPFLPYPPADRSDTHAGMFAVMLHDAGVLHDPSVLDCPCNGALPHAMKELASFEQVDQIRRTDPDRYQKMLCWDYAYNVGYRQDADHLCPLLAALSSRIPVLADQPDHVNFASIRAGNSPNHAGRGQNVLFGDGSVHWLPTRNDGPADPDIYLNNNGQPRPGSNMLDSVLMPSKVPFHGR